MVAGGAAVPRAPRVSPRHPLAEPRSPAALPGASLRDHGRRTAAPPNCPIVLGLRLPRAVQDELAWHAAVSEEEDVGEIRSYVFAHECHCWR